MKDDYTVLATFEYSKEAHLYKSKLDSEGIKTMLMDESTIDSDPLISQAIGGVKLLIYNNDLEKALNIYSEIREYEKDNNGNPISCPKCISNRILVVSPQRENLFFMLFPFF